ncbi:MAG TPA: tetratricopeptide repeat protein [Blastocatellia bacterium]|nr:tetratricopeptide repeat protein [Blastocatellia bacterium]
MSSGVINAGTGGTNSIHGHIYYPGGRVADERLRVRLRGAHDGEQFTMSDGKGSFVFTYLRGGTYDLTVDAGDRFERVEQRVDIFSSTAGGGQAVTVQIYLEAKKVPPGRVGTVDAASADTPEAALILFKKAIEADREGNRVKAVELLKEALAIHALFFPALNELGLQYLRLKQPDKAADALRSALEIAPDAFAPRLNLGVALLHLKDFKAASTELRRAINLDDGSAPVHMHMGRAHIGLQDYRAAEKELQRALSIGGDDVVEAHRFLGVAYIELKEDSRAADQLENYLRLAARPNDAARIREIIERLRRPMAGGRP